MPRGLVVTLAAALVGAVGACQEHEFQPPDRAAQVAEAEREFAAMRFDTITWASDSARALLGNSLYASECRSCHGTLGAGETRYAAERDLEVPSLVEENWAYADDLQGIRRSIYAGHAQGMSSWGVTDFTPRDVDAAAYYVLERLRPEVLGGGR